MDCDVARTLRWIAGVALALIVLTMTLQVLLLVFAGVLFAIPLRRAADWLAKKSGVSSSWTLAATLIVIFGVIGAAVWLLAPEIASQSRELFKEVPRSWEGLQASISGLVGDGLVDQVSSYFNAGKGTMRGLLGNLFGAVSGTVGAVGSGFVIFFMALYLAVEPGIYRRGLIHLVPPQNRSRANELLNQIGETLLWWLIGKLISMTLVGVLTYVGLLVLDVPLSLSLALMAAILAFIPNFGPILAAAPAILLALSDGFTKAGWVIGLYLAVQTVESYFVTPIIQQRTVSLPPAFTLAMQIVAGVLAGVAGLALATPLAAAGLVLVRELYVKDTSGQPKTAPSS
ncbi:putative PurR-regulated permease PerM [Nitrobacter vulgaris]|uniref:AI-2E family transporter n=1 Tax=Nitrobacter vulgaris TaxID=29421 RepID=UPI00285CAC9E|nr:AI-2E family transporter [Nitrobacter vulgaris]MDR6306058.1 putative PurR-regulated permease PerM [Nitrobacter vulgaris]